MRPAIFEVTLAFGLSAAVGGALWLTFMPTLILGIHSGVAFLWLSVVIYVLVVAPGGRAVVPAAAAGAIALLALERYGVCCSWEFALAAIVIGALRGRQGRAGRCAERALIELGVGLAALAAAHLLLDESTLGFSLGVWGFWLAHSAWPLFGRSSNTSSRLEDPFEVAERRARQTLSALRSRDEARRSGVVAASS